MGSGHIALTELCMSIPLRYCVSVLAFIQMLSQNLDPFSIITSLWTFSSFRVNVKIPMLTVF